MTPFSDRMFPDSVTFGLAVTTTDDRGGTVITYTDGAPVRAYVETFLSATSISEPADQKPVSRTRYRIFTGADPSAGRGRTIQIDDRAVWTDSANGARTVTLHVVSTPNPQGPLWLTEAERVT